MAAVTPEIRYVLCPVTALSFVVPAAVSAEGVQYAESNWYLQAGGYMHYSDKDEYEGPP